MLLKHGLCIQWASFCGHFRFVWHVLLCPNGNGYLTSSWNPDIMLCSLVGLTAIYYTAPISVKHGWRPCLLRGRYFKPLQELCHLSKIETWKRFFESFWKAFMIQLHFKLSKHQKHGKTCPSFVTKMWLEKGLLQLVCNIWFSNLLDIDFDVQPSRWSAESKPIPAAPRDLDGSRVLAKISCILIKALANQTQGPGSQLAPTLAFIGEKDTKSFLI